MRFPLSIYQPVFTINAISLYTYTYNGMFYGSFKLTHIKDRYLDLAEEFVHFVLVLVENDDLQDGVYVSDIACKIYNKSITRIHKKKQKQAKRIVHVQLEHLAPFRIERLVLGVRLNVLIDELNGAQWVAFAVQVSRSEALGSNHFDLQAANVIQIGERSQEPLIDCFIFVFYL